MKQWILKIVLKSDFCTATGEDIPGITNIKTALQYGIPFIPAKRIKGCLLDAGKEMADNDVISEKILFRIFGRPGMDRNAGVYIEDAHLSSVPRYLFDKDSSGNIEIQNYECFQNTVQSLPELNALFLESVFTRMRTRTALDETTGTAGNHSLRTVQVVPAGIIFSARIRGDLTPEEETVLSMCAKGLRHMGVGSTRGLGEIRCILEAAPNARAASAQKSSLLFNEYREDDVIRLSYEIELEMPVILADGGRGADYIPASAVLGALAGMYIKKYSLGKNAHKNKDFARIFLHDGVWFSNSFLNVEGMKLMPCPKALALLKDDPSIWMNTLTDQNNLRRKSISGQISLQEGQLSMALPQKEIHFHHARPVDRGIGHALNDRVKNTGIPMGQFFEYTALSKGQTFCGLWEGKMRDIRQLVECLEEQQFRLMLGRSRSAEYGRCIFRMTGVESNKVHCVSSKGKAWFIWLLSPFIYQNPENGSYLTDSRPLLEEMERRLDCPVELKSCVCSSTVFDGYNSKWRLPSLPSPALAAGSSFLIETGIDIEAWQIEDHRWGMLTGKGCGQVKAVPEAVVTTGKVIKLHKAKRPLGGKIDELTDEIVSFHEKLLARENAVSKALEKFEQSNKGLPASSDISWLIQLLKAQTLNTDCHNAIVSAVKQIRSTDKQGRIHDFIECCAGQSFEFIEQYLEAAKWEARKREGEDERAE